MFLPKVRLFMSWTDNAEAAPPSWGGGAWWYDTVALLEVTKENQETRPIHKKTRVASVSQDWMNFVQKSISCGARERENTSVNKKRGEGEGLLTRSSL